LKTLSEEEIISCERHISRIVLCHGSAKRLELDDRKIERRKENCRDAFEIKIKLIVFHIQDALKASLSCSSWRNDVI
jgi:hypothetical protein